MSSEAAAAADQELRALVAVAGLASPEEGWRSRALPNLVEAAGGDCADLAQVRAFLGRHRNVLQREGAEAVAQLAFQEPDDSFVFAHMREAPLRRLIAWSNKPQQADPCIATFKLRDQLKSVAVSKTRIVGSTDTSIFVYDRETEEMVQELDKGRGMYVMSVAIFEPEGEGEGRIVAACSHGEIKVWSAAALMKLNSTTSTLGTFRLKAEEAGAHRGEDTVQSVAFSPDGQTIVSCAEDRTVKLWSADTLELKAETWAHSCTVSSVAFSPDGQTIVSGSHDEDIKVWHAKTLQLKAEVPEAHSDYITSLAFSPDGQTIVSGSRDRAVKLWHAKTLELKAEVAEAHSDSITSLAFSPDGQTIVSASRDEAIKVWNEETLELKTEQPRAHSSCINSVAFSPDGQTIVSASSDKAIKVWNTDAMKVKAKKPYAPHEHSSRIDLVAFSPDGQTIVSASRDEAVKVFSADTFELKAGKRYQYSSRVSSVAFSPDGQTIVSGWSKGAIELWYADTLDVKVEKPEAHHCVPDNDFDRFDEAPDVISVAFSPDGQTIVSSATDRAIKLWRADTLELKVEKLQAVTQDITPMAFSPDGQTIVSGAGKAFKVWHADTLELKAEKSCDDDDWVFSLAFSPDGQTIVSGSKGIKVWCAETLELKAEVPEAHSDFVTSLSFSPDGQTIVSSSYDEVVKMWIASSLERTEECKGDGATIDGTNLGEVPKHDGTTLRLKDSGCFYAPSPLLRCVAMKWPKLIAVGAMSGEIYHLEVEGTGM